MVSCPLALLGTAFYPVLVHRHAASLHASFPHSRTTLVEGRLRKTYKHGKPIDRWDVRLKEHHEAYIDWAEFERNQKQLAIASDRQVIGYYALSAGSIAAPSVTGRLRQNMPDPLPVIVLGRLAVHTDWAGRGIGGGLLKDAVLRAI